MNCSCLPAIPRSPFRFSDSLSENSRRKFGGLRWKFAKNYRKKGWHPNPVMKRHSRSILKVWSHFPCEEPIPLRFGPVFRSEMRTEDYKTIAGIEQAARDRIAQAVSDLQSEAVKPHHHGHFAEFHSKGLRKFGFVFFCVCNQNVELKLIRSYSGKSEAVVVGTSIYDRRTVSSFYVGFGQDAGAASHLRLESMWRALTGSDRLCQEPAGGGERDEQEVWGGEGEVPRGQKVQGIPTLLITNGFNKDHRPDLKQLLWILTTAPDGTIPIGCSVHDGDTSDDQTRIRTWDTLCRVTGRTDFLYVADSKLCTKENIEQITSRNGRFLTILPKPGARTPGSANGSRPIRPPGSSFRARTTCAARTGQTRSTAAANRRCDRSRATASSGSGVRRNRLWIAVLRQERIERAVEWIEQLRERIHSPRSRLAHGERSKAPPPSSSRKPMPSGGLKSLSKSARSIAIPKPPPVGRERTRPSGDRPESASISPGAPAMPRRFREASLLPGSLRGWWCRL
jgi:hypothetical protein